MTNLDPLQDIRAIDEVLHADEPSKMHGEYLTRSNKLALMGLRKRAVLALIKNLDDVYSRKAKA